jgi:phosphoglycerate dehydrogenase-like enzyme
LSRSDPDPKVVLAPTTGESIPSALRNVGGIELVTPGWDDVATALADAEVLVSFLWRDEFLTPSLRWIQSISAGTEQFPASRLEEAGVVLTSAVGIHGPQVAEHALALLLALTRGVGRAALQRAGRDWSVPPVYEIGGMTMAVLGLGVLGEAIAERAKALGMSVIGVKRDVAGYDGNAEEVYPPERLTEVLERADVAVVTLPGGEETRHLIGADEIGAIGAGWLINVGRGSVVDERALIAALEDGGLRGAGLDVFEDEPLCGDSPLWDLANVVMTPHVAGASPHYGVRLAEIFRANLAAFRGNGEWVNRVC